MLALFLSLGNCDPDLYNPLPATGTAGLAQPEAHSFDVIARFLKALDIDDKLIVVLFGGTSLCMFDETFGRIYERCQAWYTFGSWL